MEIEKENKIIKGDLLTTGNIIQIALLSVILLFTFIVIVKTWSSKAVIASSDSGNLKVTFDDADLKMIGSMLNKEMAKSGDSKSSSDSKSDSDAKSKLKPLKMDSFKEMSPVGLNDNVFKSAFIEIKREPIWGIAIFSSTMFKSYSPFKCLYEKCYFEAVLDYLSSIFSRKFCPLGEEKYFAMKTDKPEYAKPDKYVFLDSTTAYDTYVASQKWVYVVSHLIMLILVLLIIIAPYLVDAIYYNDGINPRISPFVSRNVILFTFVLILVIVQYWMQKKFVYKNVSDDLDKIAKDFTNSAMVMAERDRKAGSGGSDIFRNSLWAEDVALATGGGTRSISDNDRSVFDAVMVKTIQFASASNRRGNDLTAINTAAAAYADDAGADGIVTYMGTIGVDASNAPRLAEFKRFIMKAYVGAAFSPNPIVVAPAAPAPAPGGAPGGAAPIRVAFNDGGVTTAVSATVHEFMLKLVAASSADGVANVLNGISAQLISGGTAVANLTADGHHFEDVLAGDHFAKLAYEAPQIYSFTDNDLYIAQVLRAHSTLKADLSTQLNANSGTPRPWAATLTGAAYDAFFDSLILKVYKVVNAMNRNNDDAALRMPYERTTGPADAQTTLVRDKLTTVAGDFYTTLLASGGELEGVNSSGGGGGISTPHADVFRAKVLALARLAYDNAGPVNGINPADGSVDVPTLVNNPQIVAFCNDIKLLSAGNDAPWKGTLEANTNAKLITLKNKVAEHIYAVAYKMNRRFA